MILLSTIGFDRTQAQSPAISSIMRDRRVQFLPVQWRASLKLDLGEELQKQKEGLDNRFTLEGERIAWTTSVYF